MLNNQGNMQTFGEHLDVLRKMLFRIVVISFFIAFCLIGFKDCIFDIILAPCTSEFSTFQFVNSVLHILGSKMDVYNSQIETSLASSWLICQYLYMWVFYSLHHILYMSCLNSFLQLYMIMRKNIHLG